MPELSASQTELQPVQQPERFRGAIWTLLILAPVITEVLSGTTRLSILFVLVPEIAVWGVGALVSRELVRRWRAGWPSLLALGLALSVAEEFLIQQTSIAPLPFPGGNAAYSRWGGVNWVFFLFMLAFESVWVVLIPVKVTELLFPRFAAKPWLRMRGLIVCGIAFLLGCRVAWYGWVKVARLRMHAAPYHPPLAMIASGALAILALITLAWLLRGVGGEPSARGTVPAWVAGVAAAVASMAWFFLLVQVFLPHPQLDAQADVLAELALAVIAFALFAYWSASARWSSLHGWAACFGASFGSSVITSVNLAIYTRPDAIFKITVDLLSVIGFLWLGARVHRQQSAAKN